MPYDYYRYTNFLSFQHSAFLRWVEIDLMSSISLWDNPLKR